MLLTQQRLADETKQFLTKWGLKAYYVAAACNISKEIMSKFVNHKMALTSNQMFRLREYILDYQAKNG